jgi:hypothetical protein
VADVLREMAWGSGAAAREDGKPDQVPDTFQDVADAWEEGYNAPPGSNNPYSDTIGPASGAPSSTPTPS